MEYTIEEKNLERQYLLAQFLNPYSIKALNQIKLKEGAKILDLGCGLGETTKLLSECFPTADITGVDQDAELIDAARATKMLPGKSIRFMAGNALSIPFAAESFDFVFTRYLLHHIPNNFGAMKEMKRVCKSGGIVFVHEPDVTFMQSYPESWAYPALKEFVSQLFADVNLGRKLFSYFNLLGLENIGYDASMKMAVGQPHIKKFYSMTAEALGKSILQHKLTDEAGLRKWIQELKRIEKDDQSILLLHPAIAIWGQK